MYAFFLVHFRLAAQIFHKLIFGITRMLMTYLFMSLFINYCLQFSSIFLKMEKSMLNSCNDFHLFISYKKYFTNDARFDNFVSFNVNNTHEL